MTSLTKRLSVLVFLFTLLGCGASEPAAPPPPPPAQNQAAPVPSTAALVQEPPPTAPVQTQPPPTPTATLVVVNTTQASAETAPEVANTPASEVIPPPTPTHPTTLAPEAAASSSVSVDLTHLPLGDGKLANGPQVGWIWACQTNPQAGGAFQDGPWINGDGTYDFTAKAIVDGSVTWPYQFEITLQGDRRVFTSNDLPNHATGIYPIAQTDDAYQTDRNPHGITAQNFQFDLPANPTLAAQPSCVPGAIGILLTGSVLFNALDAPGRDAVAHETQDGCQGHPQEAGVYHYHSLTTCLDDARTSDGHSALMGYILDGFGIYGRYGEGGQELTSADLDECHGHTHMIEWDGQRLEMYHYHATWDFPYTVGCMRGTVDMADMMAVSGALGGVAGGPPQGGQGSAPVQGPGNGQPPQGGPSGGRPDLAAAAAQLGITEQQLREALGPPPPNLTSAAAKLGISEEALRQALGAP